MAKKHSAAIGACLIYRFLPENFALKNGFKEKNKNVNRMCYKGGEPYVV